MNFEDLQIGTVFLYFGPRRLPFGRRGVAVGRVIGLDAEVGVVHVRTYRTSQNDAPPEPEIAHLPILFSRLEESLHSTRGVQAFDPSSLDSVSAWRARHHRGEVGAFKVTLWRAERLAWQATPSESFESVLIEHAFPKPNPEGVFSIVEVACTPRR